MSKARGSTIPWTSNACSWGSNSGAPRSRRPSCRHGPRGASEPGYSRAPWCPASCQRRRSRPMPDWQLNVWRSLAGSKYFIARRSFSVVGEFTPEIQGSILRTVAGVTPATTSQRQNLSDLAVEEVFYPAPAGGNPPGDAGRRVDPQFHRRLRVRALARHAEPSRYLHDSRRSVKAERGPDAAPVVSPIITLRSPRIPTKYEGHSCPTSTRGSTSTCTPSEQAGDLRGEHPNKPLPSGSGPPAAHRLVRG